MPSVQQIASQNPGMQQLGMNQNDFYKPFQLGQNGSQPLKKRSGIGNFFLGEQEQYQHMPTQTPQGIQALQQLLSGGMQGLQDPYAGFDPIAQQAQEQFSTQTIPGLAERFTSFGGAGTGRSSAFEGANVSAAQGLQRQLAAMKSQYGLENRQGLLNQLQLGLSPQFETQHKSQGQGALQVLLQNILGPAAQGAAGGFGQQAGQTLGGKAFGQPTTGQRQSPSDLIKQLIPLLAI